MNLKNHIINNKLKILAKPNAPKTKIIGFDETKQAVKISIAAPPDKNKANLELIKFISKKNKKRVKIISGSKNKEKTLELT